jgi:hypothetical protein
MTRSAFERFEHALQLTQDSIRLATTRIADSLLVPGCSLQLFIDAVGSVLNGREAVVAYSPGMSFPAAISNATMVPLPSVACGLEMVARWAAIQRREKWGITSGMAQLSAAASAVLHADANLLITPAHLILLR